MSEPEVLKYDSIEDLEETISEIYKSVERLDSEIDTLETQVELFLDTNYVSEDFWSSARYIEQNLPHETLPEIALQYSEKELEQPQDAENWQQLEEASEMAENLADRFRTTYHRLWSEFGFEGEDLQDEIEGIPPVRHFLNIWEE